MAITGTETVNSLAAQFDVDLVFYAGKIYDTLTLSSYTSVSTDSNIDFTGWTNVTSYIKDSGNLNYSRDGNSLTWRATLSGNDYDDSYFDIGMAIMCLQKISINGVQNWPATGNYILWFIGQITDINYSDEYTHRGAWSCTVGGVDTLLQRATAPRIAANKVNLLSNATVEASSTLVTPALEANTGEFPGTLVNVDPENTVDANINTLWISEDPVLALTLDYNDDTNTITRLFVNPIPGYDQSKLWWFEWISPGVAANFVRIRNQDEVDLILSSDVGVGRTVICANKENFESYVGNTNGIAAIIDVRTKFAASGADVGSGWEGNASTCPWQLSASRGWFQIYDWYDMDAVRAAVAWEDTGKTQTPPSETWGGWSGCSIVTGTASPGWGWLCSSPGIPAGYVASKYCYPGTFYDTNSREWLLYTLEQQSAVLTASATAGNTSITLSSTLGLLDSGSAICEADVFSYTGRTTSTLTGIPDSGSLAISNHANGAAINQMVDDVMQTGWPCSQLEMFRPHNSSLERILHGEIYTARTGAIAPRNPDEADWEQDYDDVIVNFALGGGAGYDYSTVLNGTTDGTGPRWVQYLLLYFKQMSNNARARMNEVKLMLSQTQVDYSGLGNINSITAGALAHYIFDQAGTTTYLSDGTSPDFGPFIGEHATAIEPYTDVLDDLARITGCVIDWGKDGIPLWRHDLWWPMDYVNSYHAKYATLDATYLRGDIAYSGIRPNEVGVKISAKTPDGLNQYNAEFPSGMTAAQQKIEYDDLVIANVGLVDTLAQTMYYKNGLFYQAGAQEANFILTGVGEWLRPEIWLQIYTNSDTGKVGVIPSSYYETGYSYYSYLIDSVTWEWGRNDKAKIWQATAHCRRYWQA